MPTHDQPPARHRPIPWMDKSSGWKGSAFTWAMGNLILLRIADGESVKAITADPRMPAYCTVFRWMQVVPGFGEAVAGLRRMMAQVRVEEADNLRRARGRRRSGQREQVPAEVLGRFLERIYAGASMSEAVAQPGAPSAKVIYSRVRKCPGFRAAFVDACRVRDLTLAMRRYDVIDHVAATGFRTANAALRALDARRGRLRPKLYRGAA